MRVMVTDGRGAYVVRVHERDMPPGMEMVVVVDAGGPSESSPRAIS